jgi:ParB family chromosome partitioning protein
MAKRSGLGKGLGALFTDNNTEDGMITSLKISEIEPNRNQPREYFEDEALRELADSIREHGVIQPLVVRPLESGGYQIVAGERRWRASRMVGLSEVPVVIRELDDLQTLEIAIIENLQREDLNPVELALGYKALMEQHGMTQEQVADKVGKSRPVVANTIRLLALPKDVLEHVRSGKISRGHAKALLSLDDAETIRSIAGRILTGGILVRDIEKLAKEKKDVPKPAPDSEAKDHSIDTGSEPVWGDSLYKELEIALSTELGRKVRILSYGKGGKGTMELGFYNSDDLLELAGKLTRSVD